MDKTPDAHETVRLTSEAAAALAELERKCFDLPWTEKEFAQAFTNKSFLAYGIWETADHLAGYMVVYHIADELEILNIAVRKEQRGQGMGRKLMQTALHTGKKMGILSAFLEVRVSNAPAIHLYESFGFTQVGRRHSYYQDTGEDALVYKLTL